MIVTCDRPPGFLLPNDHLTSPSPFVLSPRVRSGGGDLQFRRNSVQFRGKGGGNGGRMVSFWAQVMILLGQTGAILLTAYLLGWCIWWAIKWVRRRWR